MSSQILKEVIAYTHLHDQHPSKRQTFKIFSVKYYHPQAQKLSRTMCRECNKCTMKKENGINKTITIRVTWSQALKPSKPFEGLTLDVIELLKCKNGDMYGLIIVDLY